MNSNTCQTLPRLINALYFCSQCGREESSRRDIEMYIGIGNSNYILCDECSQELDQCGSCDRYGYESDWWEELADIQVRHPEVTQEDIDRYHDEDGKSAFLCFDCWYHDYQGGRNED